MRDVVSIEEDEVGFERIDAFDDAIEKEGLRVLVEMDIAEQNHAEAMKARREVVDVNGAVDNLHFMASDLPGVKNHAGRGDA